MDRGEDQQGAAQQEGQVGGGRYEVGSGGSVTAVSGVEIVGSVATQTVEQSDHVEYQDEQHSATHPQPQVVKVGVGQLRH